MKLGYSISSFYPPDVSATAAASAAVERARVAREVGFDYVQAGDHHAVSTGGYLQNVPMVARLAAVSDRVAALFLLPVYDPVLVAEQAGTLAALAGDFQLWCAIGGADQVEAMGVPPAERVPRFEEALSLIRRLWTDEAVSFGGEFYEVTDLSVTPKADPRIAIGGSVQPAVRRAGRLGDAWVAGPAEPLDALERKRGWFEDAGGGDVLVRRDAIVLEDGARARELAREALASGYRGWPADADWVLAGDAAEVASELDRLREVGADEVVVRPMLDAHAEETLRGLGRASERSDRDRGAT